MDRNPEARSVAHGSAAHALAEAALRISASTIDGALAELRSIGQGDHEVLIAACSLLRLPAGAQPRDRAIQHMAFSLVSALFKSETQS